MEEFMISETEGLEKEYLLTAYASHCLRFILIK